VLARTTGLADLASTQKELEAALKEVHTFVNTTVATLIQTTKQTAAEAQTKGQDPLQQSKTYWLATSGASVESCCLAPPGRGHARHHPGRPPATCSRHAAPRHWVPAPAAARVVAPS